MAWPRRRPTRWGRGGDRAEGPRPPQPPPSPLCVRPAGAAQRGGAEGSHRGGAGQAGVSRGSGRDSPRLPGSSRDAAAARRARPLREPGRGRPRHGKAQLGSCRAGPGAARVLPGDTVPRQPGVRESRRSGGRTKKHRMEEILLPSWTCQRDCVPMWFLSCHCGWSGWTGIAGPGALCSSCSRLQ